jgi:hypothetical protein
MNEPRQNCFVFNTLIAFLAFLPCSDLKAQMKWTSVRRHL